MSLGPKLRHFTPQTLDLQLLGLLLTVAGEGLLRIRAELLHPFAQDILVHIEVSRSLRDTHTSFPNQTNGLDLERTHPA